MAKRSKKRISQSEYEEINYLNLPPQSVEAEQAVIGGILIDNKAWDKIVDLVSVNDFYKLEHRIIFAKISDMLNLGKPVDVLTLKEALIADSGLNAAGGEFYVYQILRNTPTAANIKHYADIVRDKAARRALITAANDIVEDSMQPEGKDVVEIVQDALEEIVGISENNGPREIKEAKNIIGAVLADIDSRAGRGGIVGLSTGYADFDKITHGLHHGDLIILAGRPSMGKTVLAINMAENVSIKDGKTVLVFSLEMSAEQLIERSLASIAKIEASKLKSGFFSQDECTKMSNALPAFNNSKLFIDDRASLSVAEMRSACRKIKKDHGLSLVVVDYLTLMAGDGENEVIRIGNISRGLKLLARDLEVPIVAISQLNRAVEQRNDKRPLMADLRQSGAIEQDADLILFIYRDEVYHPETTNKNIAELIIAKNRNGEIGTLNLFFNKNFCRFDSFTGKYVKYEPTQQTRTEFNY